MSTPNAYDTAHFSEFQRFNNKIFISIMLVLEPLIIIVAVLGFQDNPQFIIVMGLTAVLPVVLLLLALNTKLESHIDRNGISFRWSPFQTSFKKISWQEIAEAKVIQHGFLGYGWRVSPKYGNVHNVKGDKGLFIQLKNRTRYLIGTQKPEELKHVLTHLLQANN